MLATIAIAIALTISSLTGAIDEERCPVAEAAAGICPRNTGSEIIIGATETQSGGSDGGSANSGGQDSNDSDNGSSVGPAPTPTCPPILGCRGNYLVVGPPEVTINDLASFRPAAPSLSGEPAGFGLLGAPTNVVAAASSQDIAGTLLGREVTVRFVPTGYVFDYGDGSTASSSTGGTSWASLGQLQLSPTSTSHVYRERGTFSVSASVQYSPSVNFGSGVWRPVAGFVTATSGSYNVQIVEARTALVAKTCVENPSGPGC